MAAIQLPDGSTLSYCALASLGAAKVMSALSNATEAVAVLASGHSIVDDDILIIFSGWLKANKRIARATNVDTDNNVTFEGIDTSSTTRFPVGSGTGTIQEVPAAYWVQIPYVKDFAGQGGEQQFVTEEFLDSDDQYEFPTSRTPRRYSCGVAFQGTTATHFGGLRTASENRHEIPFRITYPDGSLSYFLALVSFDPVPTVTKGQVQVNTLTMAVRAEPTVYAAA